MSDKRARERLQRNRLLIRQEKLAERDLAALIIGMGGDLSRRLIPGANEPALAAVDELQPEIAKVLRDRILQTALIFGERTQEQIRAVMPKSYYPGLAPGTGPVRGRDFVELEGKGFWEIFQETIRTWADLHALARAVTVTGTIKEAVRAVLRQAQDEGWGEAITARAIQAEALHLSRTNAARIARTEMHTASSIGSDEAARSTGLQLVKEWVSAEDGRTRFSHAVADGQERALDDPFHVGSDHLMVPGDPKGSAKEIINCRCQVLHHPVIGGRVIR